MIKHEHTNRFKERERLKGVSTHRKNVLKKHHDTNNAHKFWWGDAMYEFENDKE